MIFKLIIMTILSASVSASEPETLVFSFQKQKNPEELKSAAKQASEYLSKKINKKVEVVIPTSYGATVQGLISDKVHIAYMDSLPYIIASAETALQIIAVEKRNGKANYDSLLVVGKDSPIKSLKDLKGKHIAFSSQTSTSGYLFPFHRLITEKQLGSAAELNQFFSQVTYAGGYDKALLAVANGQADVGAFSDYAFEGAKADLYGTPETRSKVRVLARTPGVPTHLIAVSKSLPKPLIQKIQKALFDLTKENPSLLASVYGTASLVRPNTSHVENTLRALKSTNLEARSFVK